VDDVQAIPRLLKVLRESNPPDGKVLSVYLDISPKRIAGQAYLMAYRDLCKDLRAQLPAAERKPFEAAATQAERFLVEEFAPRNKGLAIFASGSPGYFYSVPLPERPSDQMSWDASAHLEPLQWMLDECERTAVVLFDQGQARLFTIYLGLLEEHLTIDGDVPRKQKTGGWAALRQSRFSRHRDDHVLRHAKHTATALMTMYRSHPFDRLLVGGPDEPLAVLTHQLPPALRDRIAGTLRLEPFSTDAEIVRATLDALESCERRGEVALIDELLDGESSAHAALGVRDTLDALNEGRTHVLFIADSFEGFGGECPSCGRLTAGPGPCPSCGVPTEPVPDLGESVIQRALDQGARVEIVSGDAAARLLTRGGLGAWTRY
jgi:peptide subunit release factor 1 (eRF1)